MSGKKAVSKSQAKRHEKERLAREGVLQAFHTFYGAFYGDRWPRLYDALLPDSQPCALVNPTAAAADFQAWQQQLGDGSSVAGLVWTAVVRTGPEPRLPPPPRDCNGRLLYYCLDAASLLAPQALQVQPHHRVLDMCAAPGGKALALMQQLAPGKGTLTANDPSPDRRRRLTQVFNDYFPEDVRSRVTVTGYDATRWPQHEQGLYNRVLVDAPCSTERHLVRDDQELLTWTTRRPAHNHSRQVGLLTNALGACAVGGRVVYSTCALSAVENDQVVEKVVRRMGRRLRLRLVRPQYPFGEPTRLGWIVLPDTAGGRGPLYISVVEKEGVRDDASSGDDTSDDD